MREIVLNPRILEFIRKFCSVEDGTQRSHVLVTSAGYVATDGKIVVFCPDSVDLYKFERYLIKPPKMSTKITDCFLRVFPDDNLWLRTIDKDVVATDHQLVKPEGDDYPDCQSIAKCLEPRPNKRPTAIVFDPHYFELFDCNHVLITSLSETSISIQSTKGAKIDFVATLACVTGLDTVHEGTHLALNEQVVDPAREELLALCDIITVTRPSYRSDELIAELRAAREPDAEPRLDDDLPPPLPFDPEEIDPVTNDYD